MRFSKELQRFGSRPRCPGAIQQGIAMVWLPSSKLKTGQIGIGCSRTRKCSQRYEIDHFWTWFFASVQSLKFFLNPIREPAVSFNPTSQLLLKLRCGSTDVIWKYLSLLGFATGIIFHAYLLLIVFQKSDVESEQQRFLHRETMLQARCLRVITFRVRVV